MSNPLQGKRIVVTRSAAQAASFGHKLAQLGAEPILFPVIRFVPLAAGALDAALAHFDRYDWLLFTSVNAVNFFFRQVDSRGLSLTMPRVAATGSVTAGCLRQRGLSVDFTPDTFAGEKLAAGLGDLTGQRVLLPRARIGRPEIVEALRRQGAAVDDVALYDTVTAVPDPAALAKLSNGFDALAFASPSSVRHFLKILHESRPQKSWRLLRSSLDRAIIACIGPVTADEARRNGLTVSVVPNNYTIDSMIEAFISYFETVKRSL